MNDEIKKFIENYPCEIIEMFHSVRRIIFECAPTATETLWAKMPSYYFENCFIRIIPFKNHINVEAKAVFDFIDELSEYKITPKGMLQIYSNQNIPIAILKKIFIKTFLP